MPTAYGGQGGSLLDLTILAEVVSGRAAGLALALASHYTVVELILNFGSDQQKSRYLPLLARGELIGAQAFSEVNAGSDYQAVTTEAALFDGGATLTGLKSWVVNGEISQLLAVLAKTGGDLSLWLVEANTIPSASLVVGPAKSKLGLRAAVVNDISFKSHMVAIENRLAGGSAGQVQKAVEGALDLSKTVLAGAALGLADEALELGAQRARTHEPIWSVDEARFTKAFSGSLPIFLQTGPLRQLLTYRAAWS